MTMASAADDHRRLGLDFAGTRPALTLGGPGFDGTWIRRHRLGTRVATIWYVALPILLRAGFISARASFGCRAARIALAA